MQALIVETNTLASYCFTSILEFGAFCTHGFTISGHFYATPNFISAGFNKMSSNYGEVLNINLISLCAIILKQTWMSCKK